MDFTEAVNEGRRLLAANASVEDVLILWRANGLSILHSIQALRHLTDRSLTEAKHVVHNSQAWRDMRAEYDRFHDEIEQAVEDVDDSERASNH